MASTTAEQEDKSAEQSCPSPVSPPKKNQQAFQISATCGPQNVIAEQEAAETAALQNKERIMWSAMTGFGILLLGDLLTMLTMTAIINMM